MLNKKLGTLTRLARDESTGPSKFKDGLYYTATPGGYTPIFKSLITNKCVNDCKYCVNRSNSNIERVEMSPEEFAALISRLDKAGRISGAFISSGIYPDVNRAQENLFRTAKLLRKRFGFSKYLHVKIMPGADLDLIRKCSRLADRVSVNTETTGDEELSRVARRKKYRTILKTLRALSENSDSVITQVMAGVAEDTDYDLIRLAEDFYRDFGLRRVFFSGFRSENNEVRRPSESEAREYRLYQCDSLLKDYGFSAEQIFRGTKNLDLNLDPKANWVINNLDRFPVELKKADRQTLLTIPGIGPKTADKILSGGKIPKKAQHFLQINGKYQGESLDRDFIYNLLSGSH